MEQYPQYLVWMKNKYMMNSRFQAPTNTFKNSWEEQAFFATDDAAFIWPPRSYSCSFCKRKFRSAQALGGHMNVHRRDRARLKQSLPSQNEVLPHQISTPNPSHNTNSDPSYLAFSHSPSIVSDLKHAAEKNPRREDFPLMGHGDHVGDEANLSMGLNLVVSENISKRPKTNVLPMPLFLLPCSNDRLGVVKDGSFQGVDLELRLGQ